MSTTNVVNRETAEKDIDRWLDAKNVKPSKREAYADYIETLIEAVMDGSLAVSAEGVLTFKLSMPIGVEEKISALTFKNRLTVGALNSELKGVKAGDQDGRMVAYVAALTGLAKASVEKLDSSDYAVPTSVAVFFS